MPKPDEDTVKDIADTAVKLDEEIRKLRQETLSQPGIKVVKS